MALCLLALVTLAPCASAQSASGVSVSPKYVAGGTNSTGTVTLSAAAPTGGASVTLTSSNPSTASVPATVTVPAGQTSANFTITTTAPTSQQVSTITASYGGNGPFTNVYVEPANPTLISLSLQPPEVTGGVTSPPAYVCSAYVTLSSPAYGSGLTVNLSSDNTVAQAPATIVVPAGQTSGNVTISTSAVTATVLAHITAVYNNGTPITQTLQVDPPQLTGFSVSPSSVTGTQTVTLNLTLSGPVATGYVANIAMACSNGHALSQTPPAGVGNTFTLTIPAGQSSASYPLTTSTVDYPTPITLTATYGSVTLTANLTINPANLRVVDAWVASGSTQQSPQVVLNFHWDSTTSDPQFQLQRNGVAVATVSNSTTYATDTLPANGSTVYQYTLWSVKTGGALDQQLNEEEVEVDAAFPLEDQTVDSRLDQRASTATFLDFCFGTSSYRGGLFAGFANDPARIGRSYVLFQTIAPSSGTDFRVGAIAAYCTGLNVTTTGQNVSATIGVQSIPPWTQGLCSTMVWDTQPAPSGFSAGAATSAQTISYSSGAAPPGWIGWPLSDPIRTAATNLSGSNPAPLPLGVVWAETNEATTGWAYFAKSEYNPALAPALIEVWDDPVILSLSFAPTSITLSSTSATTTTGTLTLNGVGPNDNPTVAVSIYKVTQNGSMVTTGNLSFLPIVFPPAIAETMPNPHPTGYMTVTGLARTFTLTPVYDGSWLPGTYTVTINAVYTPTNGGKTTNAMATFTLTVAGSGGGGGGH
jgi:hypothetical protein